MKKNVIFISAIAFALIACASNSNNHISDLNKIDSSTVQVPTKGAVDNSSQTSNDFPMQHGILLSSQEKFNFYSFSPGFYPEVGSDHKNTYYSFVVGDGKNPIGELGSAKKAPLVDRIKSIAIPKNSPRKFCVVTLYKLRRCTESIEIQLKETREQ